MLISSQYGYDSFSSNQSLIQQNQQIILQNNQLLRDLQNLNLGRQSYQLLVGNPMRFANPRYGGESANGFVNGNFNPPSPYFQDIMTRAWHLALNPHEFKLAELSRVGFHPSLGVYSPPASIDLSRIPGTAPADSHISFFRTPYYI